MKFLLVILIIFLYPFSIHAQSNLMDASVVQVAEIPQQSSAITYPTHITNAGDGRLFVTRADGTIWIIDQNFETLENAFLDISDRVHNFTEQGLLSMAFHPDYKDNNLFYVFYSANNGNSVVSSFEAVPDDPNGAILNSEKQIISIEVSRETNHIGGCLQFGPDGYLYISTGDSGIDNSHLSQDKTSLSGKILRIDVDNGEPYSIPDDNPYVNDNSARDEIWASGLRNPWKFSFDRLNGDMWIGDVGFNAWEEVYQIPNGNAGGSNFGWDCIEGEDLNEQANCASIPSDLFPLTYAYPHNENRCSGSITGGYLYRGQNEAINDLNAYIFTDFCTNNVTALYDENGQQIIQELFVTAGFNGATAIGENTEGELFISTGDGKIYSIDFTCNLPQLNLSYLSCPDSKDGCLEVVFADSTAIDNIRIYSDYYTEVFEESEFCNLPDGNYITEIENEMEECPELLFFEIDYINPTVISTSASNCLPGVNDGGLEINISYPSDALIITLESEDGSIIDPSQYNQLEEGIYTLNIEHPSINCSFSKEYTVRYFAVSPFLDIEVSDSLSVVDTFDRYEWLYLENVSSELIFIEDATEHYYIPNLGSGLYAVIGYIGDCPVTSNLVSIISTSTEDITSIQNLKLSPNPSQGIINIELNDQWNNDIYISIIDVEGQMVYEQNIKKNQNSSVHTINIGHLNSGIFLLQVTDSNAIKTTKFIKE